MAGGKRIRPQICLASSVAVGGRMEDALYPACAIELLHSYTLVHDDLPAMDNDTMRRGKPSVWAKFGEDTAILAGDALQSLAFQAALRAPRNGEKILAALVESAVGVVLGQSEELSTLNPSTFQPDIDFIYLHKTADLFIAAAVMGAYAGGGTEADVARLRGYALNLGMAFQYEDDLIDGDSGRSREESERRVADHTSAAIASLEGLSGDTAFLSALARRLASRAGCLNGRGVI